MKPTAIILAAGRGTRMRELTAAVPKPMLLVRGKPILAHVLENLVPHVSSIVIVVGYLHEQITSHIGTEFAGVPVVYATQENPQGGTLDALRVGMRAAGEASRGYIVVSADDIHLQESFEALATHAAQHPDDMMLVGVSAATKDDAKRFGVFEFGADGRLLRIEEKPENPPSQVINCALYYMPAAFKETAFADYAAQPNGELYLTDPLSSWIRVHGASVHVAPSWESIGTPEDLAKANRIA